MKLMKVPFGRGICSIRKEFFIMNENTQRVGITRPVTTSGAVAKPKLDLNAVKAKVGGNTLTEFRELTCIYLGASDEPKEYKPNKKDPVTGKTLKDASGNSLKEDKVVGYTYIFSEFGTSRQVRVVLQNKQKLEDLSFYQISGKGYKLDAFDFLIESNKVIRYEQ